MPRAILVVTLLCLVVTVLPAAGQAGAAAQSATSGDTAASAAPKAPVNSPRIEHPGVGKEANTPDMVCFGYYPRWSVQFGNGQARYLGYNEPDRYFDGDFYWVSDENAWEWRHDGVNVSSDGRYGLSATIERTECKDPVQKTINPYSAEVYLPEGDMVSGCCRRLRAGEAPIGHRGAPSSAVAASNSATSAPAQAVTPANNKTPVAGHPVDQY
ncbi:MAG TPA: hypothetical protein VMD98_03850 [Bryocella sp.]|nr:hypothetical protein [Bryocella sp.]